MLGDVSINKNREIIPKLLPGFPSPALPSYGKKDMGKQMEIDWQRTIYKLPYFLECLFTATIDNINSPNQGNMFLKMPVYENDVTFVENSQRINFHSLILRKSFHNMTEVFLLSRVAQNTMSGLKHPTSGMTFIASLDIVPNQQHKMGGSS